MAEVNKTPNIEQDINKETQKQTTGVENTTPVSSVSEPVQTPQTAEVIETQKPVIATQPQQPQQVADVNIQPEVTVQPQQTPQKEVKVEEIKPIQTEAPKQATTKVETVQDIKTQEIANEDLTNQLNEKKKSQVMQEFQNMVQSGATLEEIGAYWLENKQFHRDIANILRSNFKNTANTQFFGKYSTMNNEDMYAEYQQWNIVPWSEQYNMLPAEKKASFDAYLKNIDVNNSYKRYDKESAVKISDISSLTSEIPKMFSSSVRENYEKKLNSPERDRLSSELIDIQNKIEEIDDELFDAADNISEKLAWNLSWSIWAEQRKTIKELTRLKNSLIRSERSVLWRIQTLNESAQTELKLSMYEDEQARQDYQTQLSLYETRRKETLSRTQTLEDRDFALRVESERREFEQKNKEIAAQKAFEQQKELLKYKNDIEQGNIKWQWSNRFDWLYFLDDKWNATKIIDWGFETKSDWTSTFIRTDDNGNPVVEVYDITWNPIWANTNTSRFTQEQVDLLNAPAWSVIPTRLSEVSKNNVNRGKECAEYINDIFGKNIWAKMGSSYESKLKVANEKNGWLWSIAVWQPNPWDKYYSKFWHAWVIVWKSEDGKKWHIKSSNLAWDGTISVDEVPISVIDWYKTTSLYEQPIEEKTYTSAQKKYLETVDLQSFNDKKEVKVAAESLWLTAEDVFAYKGNNIDPMKKTELQDVLDWIDALLKAWDWDGLSDALWPISALNPLKYLPWTDAADFEAQFESLSGKLTLPNLEKMSWVLSDTDIKILQWASSALSLSMSEKEFKKELNRIKTSAQNSLDKLGALDNNFFTDSSGKKWSKQWLADELANLIESWKMTQEQAQDFIQKNNLNFN